MKITHNRVIELCDDIEINLKQMLKKKLTDLANQSNISKKNIELNEVSMEEYIETQEQDIVTENIYVIYQHFQGFIAKNIEKFD